MALGPAMGEGSTWTIRFKNHTTTILLHVEPLMQFSTIVEQLLNALRETHPDGLLHGIDIPSLVEHVLLAKPVDIYDHSKGWSPLRTNITLQAEGGNDEKVKTKVERSAPDQSPKAAGLRDNAVLAFKFNAQAQSSDLEDLESSIQWDVVVPSFEDNTGVVNAGDVGGLPTFTG